MKICLMFDNQINLIPNDVLGAETICLGTQSGKCEGQPFHLFQINVDDLILKDFYLS